ncbi:DNA repair protein RadC [Candidatus Microgenomates bacterium]|nr:DNA repair protein RadC [Candidatus Microgenomates bacterium]
MVSKKGLVKVKKPKGAGHRKRLRRRFLEAGLDGFLDYEVIELLLTLGTPQKDCKKMAKKAIKKFKGLHGVLEASSQELQQIKDIGPHNIFGLKLFQALSERYLKEKIPKKIKLISPKKVVDYLKQKIGRHKKEYFLILSLDYRNNLIKEDIVSVGSLNANIVHPREVFRDAIRASAASIILIHNHPSGDSTPSEDDLKITQRLVKSGKLLGIKVVDHIIIAQNGFLSFKEKGLL